MLEEENKEEEGVEEEEASPNKRTRRAGRGRSRVFGAWVVSHPVRVTVQQPAHAQPFCHSYAGSERTPPHVDGATKPYDASPTSQLEPSGGRETSSGAPGLVGIEKT